MRLYKNFPATLSDPVTDDEIYVECDFYFTPSFPATSKLPEEHPFIELISVKHNGNDTIKELQEDRYRGLKGWLLASVLENK